MNITLPPFDTEQQQALTDLVDSHNAAATTSLTSEQFLVSVLLGVINDKKRQNIIAKGEQIIAAAQSLPDEKRLQFTAAVEAAYATASA